MSVMTPAPNQPISGYRPRDVDYLALGRNQQELATRTLRDLGIDNDGHAIDAGIPTPGHRAAISATLAHQLGMALPAGHEIALCADCLTITDAHLMREGGDGAWRCDTDTDPFGNSCHQRYAHDYEQD